MIGRLSAALLLALLGAGCAERDPDLDEIGRALLHAADRGQTVAGAHAERLADRAGLRVAAEDATWRVTEDVAQPAGDWRLVTRSGPYALWGPSAPPPVERFAVRAVPEDAVALDDSIVRGIAIEGPVAPGGELVAQVFLVPPARMPLDLCLDYLVGDVAIAGGPLLDGRVAFHPGLEERPLVRHRARVAVPDAVRRGDAPLRVRLADCSSGGILHEADAGTIPVGRGRPGPADLARRSGEPDPEAILGQPEGRAAVVRTKAGIETIPPPPLPRLRLGEVWPVIVGGAVDPTGWHREGAADPEAPLLRLVPLFDRASATIVAWDAPASRHAPTRSDEARPRRAVPEALRVLAAAGIDVALLGTAHADDAGPEGEAETAKAAAALGLRVAGTDAAPSAALSLGEGAPTLAVVSADLDGAEADEDAVILELSRRVLQAREVGRVVLLQVEPGRRDRLAFGRRLARETGADGVVLLGPELGALDIVEGVPVMTSLPPVLTQSPAIATVSAVTRWYLDEDGVRRIDVLPIRIRSAEVERERGEDGVALMERFAQASRPLGTDVRVGETVAAIDVAAHWPAEERPAAPVRPPLPSPEPTDLPALRQPDRCTGAPGEDARPVPLSDGLTLLEARLLTPEIRVGEPVRVEIFWRAQRPLEAGHVSWNVTGPSTWRARSVPCDEVFGFEDFVPGQVVRDEVVLRPPADAGEGTWDLELGVRMGSKLLTRPDGGRRIQVGTLRVTGG